MSFNFEWPQFSDSFYHDAREMLAQALNKGQKPPIIADRIEVKELNMGTIPPELEILEIGDLSTDRFRGIFRLTYSGDAYIVLQTKVQANPLNVPRPSLDILGSPRILFAAAPLVVPMTLRLSDLSLRAIVVLVVSRQKGITLVFKNDPLESVQVSSSFDGVESVAGFIQREIEAQLREAFRNDLPSVIHRLSQKWLSGEVKSASEGAAGLGPKARVGLAGGFEKDAKIETRTAYAGGGQGPDGKGRGKGLTRRMSGASEAGESVDLGSQADSTWSTWGGDHTGSSVYGGSFGRSPSMRRMSAAGSMSPTVRHDQLESVPESIEAYDPTYGLRPDSIPHHAGFADYERLVKAGSSKRGLGDVLEADEAEEDLWTGQRTGDGSFDFDLIGLHDLVEDDSQLPMPRWSNDGGRPRTSFDSLEVEPDLRSQYETIPAVGGGTITRPRVFHTQSQMRMRTASTGSLSAHGSPSSATARSAGGGSAASTVGLGNAGAFGRSTSLGKLAPLDGRAEYFAAPSVSIASTPRFPFPKHPPPPAYSASSPSLVRNTSLPNFSRYDRSNTLHRSNLSWQLSSTCTSPDTLQHSTSMFPSAYSSPPSSVTSPSMLAPSHRAPPKDASSLDDPSEQDLPYTRPSPVDLLSRSPSSVLNTSFLDRDDSHLPITLNPVGNDSCAHLKTLTQTNQTLSPFTRELEGVRARSSPHPMVTTHTNGAQLAPSAPGVANRIALVPAGRGGGPSSSATAMLLQSPPQQQPVKAVRKRTHRIGSAKLSPAAAAAASPPPPHLTSTQTSLPMSPTAAAAAARALSPARSYSSSAAAAQRNRSTAAMRGSISLASSYGSSSFGSAVHHTGLGGGGGGAAKAKAPPSELSEYFPALGAREMLARLRLSSSGGGGGGGGRGGPPGSAGY
ncbi:hypothetical protein JCM1840_002830 [Sporobolomyces johnsonii]